MLVMKMKKQSEQKKELDDIKWGIMSIIEDDSFSSMRGLKGHIDENFIKIYTNPALIQRYLLIFLILIII